MRVVMRVDKTRQQQLLGRVDRLIDRTRSELGDDLSSLGGAADAAPNGRNRAVNDENIGDWGQVDIAGMVINTAIADENDAAGRPGSHEGASLRAARRYDYYSCDRARKTPRIP